MPVSLTNVIDNEHPGYVSGRYYLGAEKVSADTSSTGGLSTSGITYVPFRVYSQIQLLRLAVYCSSSSSNGNAIIGIYSNLNGLPEDLVIDGGNLIITTPGVKEAITSYSAKRAWYWFAGITSQAPYLYCGLSFVGNNHIFGQTTPSSITVNCALRNAGSYASLPAKAPKDNLSFITGNFSPLFWFKVA
jgi:hypothetical protein